MLTPDALATARAIAHRLFDERRAADPATWHAWSLEHPREDRALHRALAVATYGRCVSTLSDAEFDDYFVAVFAPFMVAEFRAWLAADPTRRCRHQEEPHE